MQEALGRGYRTQGGAPVHTALVLNGSMPSLRSLDHRGPETGPGVARCSDAGPGFVRGAGLVSASEGRFPAEAGWEGWWGALRAHVPGRARPLVTEGRGLGPPTQPTRVNLPTLVRDAPPEGFSPPFL